jgi:hypothetical protein
MYDLKNFFDIGRGDKHEEHEPSSTNAVDAETSGFANHSTVPQSLINTLD